MPTSFSKILKYYLLVSRIYYKDKSIIPEKFMNILEAATGGVL